MKVTDLSVTGTRPRWADSWGDRSTLLHGGAKLDAAAFPAGDDGRVTVPSGTVIGKNYNEDTFGPAAAGDDVIGFVWTDVVDANVNNDVEVYVAGTVKVNFLPAVPAGAIMTELKRRFVLTEGA